jgi:hypothetical protein
VGSITLQFNYSRGPGSPGGDKRDLLAQTSLNSKGHPKIIGLRQTLNKLTITAAAQLDHFCDAKKISDSARSSLLLLTNLRRFLKGLKVNRHNQFFWDKCLQISLYSC